ncbi:MAG: NAD(P)H-hydrate dehydratase [Rikenellaceae bacterium]|nr:NAD(P)H-hydrate dehydratase [Rikenellaceae bacterium]
MKILTGGAIKEIDKATMKTEGISSLELMERASEEMARTICESVCETDSLLFFIGKGNNGGDGLAVARMVANIGFRCGTVMLYPADELSMDCKFNFERLPEKINIYNWGEEFPANDYDLVVDAILGSGLKGTAEGVAKEAISYLNGLSKKVISIDIPSGMSPEPPAGSGAIVKADLTITIQFPKLSMLLPESGNRCGDIKIVDIGLDTKFTDNSDSYFFTTQEDIIPMLESRPKFSNKGSFGHALLICGSSEMFGAAILSVGGALRSGCGLVTAHIPGKQSAALLATAPSAMVSCADKKDHFTSLPFDLEKYNVCGCGPGLGQREDTVQALTRLLHAFDRPMVLDADALNMLSSHPHLQELIPEGSVLTPHPGEFERLVGKWRDENEKLEKLRYLAIRLKSTVVLKGAHTAVCLPDSSIHFNSTGTPGMAKGGSGDVLTGLITGLMARGYTGPQASVLGVYLHGLGGEKAAEYYGAEAMNSADLPDFIAEAYRELLSDAN